MKLARLSLLGTLSLSLLLSMALVPTPAQAESTAIPTTAVALKNNELPASDLLYQGQPLDPDSAVDLRKRGVDLSKIDPMASDVWHDEILPATDLAQSAFPADGSRLTYYSMMPLNPEGWFRSQVVAGNQIYRLSISLNIHQAMMRAALLRKLGYPVSSPKWMSKLTLAFADKKQKDAFVNEVSVQGGLVDHKRWIVSDDDTKNEIVLQDVMLEPARIVVPTSFFMGNLNATHIKGRRILRSLLMPFVLVDVPESINMFSWEVGQVLNGSVVLTHKYADAFGETTYDDMRWVLARLARLSREELREVVDAGRFPTDISAILLEKVVARRNGLMRLFGMQDTLPSSAMTLPFNTQISIGYVEQGKVLREQYDGYALRFTHGDPQSPLRTDDITRYIKIEGITAGIKQITSMINEKLQFWTMDQLLAKRSEALRADFINHIKTNPFKPYEQPLSTWGGPVGGIIVNASRNIVTGSYYGSQASDFKVMLVDQISAGAKIGYFLGVDGIPKVIPGIGANLMMQRSYVHVRPIPSMEAADKKKWDELWIPGFMRNLGKALDKELTGKTPEDQQKEMGENLTKFLEDLKESETFTITDSVTLSANASLTIPLATLLGMGPVSFQNSVVFGANANTIVLRRTMFIRENGFIKIYLQNIQSASMGVSFDFNWWMNVMRMSYNHKWGAAQTRAFHLDEKPTEDTKLRNTVLAVRGMLVSNNSEILESKFNPYQLDHRTSSDIAQGKFLFWRWSAIEEWHRVKVQPPKDPDHPFDPKQFERTLFSHRVLERTGHNYYSFLSDVLDGLIQNSTFFKPGLLDAKTGSDPADSFMGDSKWSTTVTEAEVTPGKESNPVTIVEHHWAGWDLTKPALFKVIDQIDARVQSLGQGYPLIDRNVFNDMRRLQLYEIRTSFVVYEEGMQRLRERLLVQDGRRGTILDRAAGWNSFSGTDKDLVTQVLIPLIGQQRFQEECEAMAMEGRSTEQGPLPTTRVIVHGRSYECLLPWMKRILDLRRSYPEDREARVKWATKLLSLLDKNVDLGKLMNWIGKDNFYFQVRISGFRTRDENGDTADYKSSTIGTISSRDRAGIFKDFVSDYQITSSELNASYLSEGY